MDNFKFNMARLKCWANQARNKINSERTLAGLHHWHIDAGMWLANQLNSRPDMMAIYLAMSWRDRNGFIAHSDDKIKEYCHPDHAKFYFWVKEHIIDCGNDWVEIFNGKELGPRYSSQFSGSNFCYLLNTVKDMEAVSRLDYWYSDVEQQLQIVGI